MLPNATCGKCDGAGKFYDWLKNADGKWYRKHVRCPRCLGMGKVPQQTSNADGISVVHFSRASPLTTDEIMTLLEDEDARKEERT